MGINVNPVYDLMELYFGNQVKLPIADNFSMCCWKVNEDLYIDHVIGRQTFRLFSFNEKFRFWPDSKITSTQSVIIAESPVSNVNEFITRVSTIRLLTSDMPPRRDTAPCNNEDVDDVEALINKCYSIANCVPFLEYYSHTDKTHWKILNHYTNYAEDKIVLGTLEEGFTHSLEMAIKEITKRKNEYFGS